MITFVIVCMLMLFFFCFRNVLLTIAELNAMYYVRRQPWRSGNELCPINEVASRRASRRVST